ncbi:very large low complexity protein [Cryptosporidium ryanae]|uniref:very large low complexity protein n=1 Tax=Cryptosporidium ryanae TaxID=515981 RepID=UPI00351A6A59|nr:very large low complexity protein [Cryptosporidium ryanae]
MNKDRSSILLESCSRSLLSYQLYIRDSFNNNNSNNLVEFEEVINIKIPKLIKSRLNEYNSHNYISAIGTTKKDILENDNIVKSLEACFKINTETAVRILDGYNHSCDCGLMVKFTNVYNINMDGNNNYYRDESKYNCYLLDEEFLSKIYDFILRDQLAFLDSIKFMYEHATFETDNLSFGNYMKNICFGELWEDNEFNILDELWKWYSRLVDSEFIEFYDPIIERIFGNPLVQCYYRMLLESNILHTILVILQSLNLYLVNPNNNKNKSVLILSDSNKERNYSLSRTTPMNRCKIILSKLQSNCFLGSLYTLYSDKNGIKINTLSYCDNALAHSSAIMDQLRQTSTNGILLACSLVLSLSPKSLTTENEDLSFLISIVITFLESLSSNDPGEIIQEIATEDVLNNGFNTPVKTVNILKNKNQQRFVRGNLILVHAKIVKPLLPSFIFSYASIVAQTPNRDTLLIPIIGRNTFFESSAFADSLENIILSLNNQNPLKQSVLVKFDSLRDNQDAGRKEKTLIGEPFGTYYQHYVLYGLIRNTISTFSLNVLPFTARITKSLSKILRKEPRLVFRECWRGDYFRQIGVHIILEMYTSFFPYGIVEFVDLLSSLLPDFNIVSKSSKTDREMAKQALKLFVEFLRSPIKFINFPPYLSSISLAPLQINKWSLETIKKGKEVLELPLHVEVSNIEIPNFTSGSCFSQSSLLGTLEGCILEFLDIQLDDVTPLSIGFPSARKCLTPLRVLSTGVSQRVPLKSLLLENSETSFSLPLWSTSPYGLTYDLPGSEMPPYFHIKEPKGLHLSPNNEEKMLSYLDINNIYQPSDLPTNSSEVKLGDLDPFTIQFCNDIDVISGTSTNNNSGTSSIGLYSQNTTIPSLLKILLLIWDAISLSFYQKNGNITNKKLIEVFVSLSELIYRLASFNRSFIFALEQEISNWNALVPNFTNSRSNTSSSTRFGMFTIKILQTLRGFSSIISNDNSNESLSHIFYSLPRLIHMLNLTMKPINLISIDDTLNYNFSRLSVNDTENDLYRKHLQNEKDFSLLNPPWAKKCENTIPMYWLVPLLLSNPIISNPENKIISDSNISIGNGGPYTSLLKGIQGFDFDEFFNLVTKTIEIVEKQIKSYPISNQVLQFISTLLEYCPVLFWGFGWDRHGKIILNSEMFFIQNKKKTSYSSTLILQKDLQHLLNECLAFQSGSLENKKDSFELFSRVSNFTIHSVLSRLQSWQFNIDSERNLLLLASINAFSRLLDSMNSITLIGDFEKDEEYSETEQTIDSSIKDLRGIRDKFRGYIVENNHSKLTENREMTTLKDIIPNISFITSSNYQSLIVTLLKHLVETGLIPTLLSFLFCEYGINSRTISKFRYNSHSLKKKDNLVDHDKSELKSSSNSPPWVLSVSNSMVFLSMIKNEYISYNLAIHMQQSNSQSIFIDRLLFQPLDCHFPSPDNLGELFCLPNVIVSQQIVSKVLEILFTILNSVSNTNNNSNLLKTLRISLLQWILSSPSITNGAGISDTNNNNEDFNIVFDEPKFNWSDSDLIAQHVHNRVNKLYQQKKPQMNVIKSLLVVILSYIPSTFPLKASLLASKLLSSLCYNLSTESNFLHVNKKCKTDLILEQILKPPISINSIQQDFLLYLTNTRLFPILNKILFQELDFILLAPIFQFLQIFDPKDHKITIKEKNSLSMVHSIIELLILIATSHPLIISCSTGSFISENSASMINTCKKYITINSSVSLNRNESKYSSNNRVRLICLAISGMLENTDILIENYLIENNIDTEIDNNLSSSQKLCSTITLLPNIFNLLTQLLEDSISRSLLIIEMTNIQTKRLSSNDFLSNSLLITIIKVTKKSVNLLNRIIRSKLSNSDIDKNQYIILNIITILSSAITCVYHFISRIIAITTYSSSGNSDELPLILKNQELFEFIQFLLSDDLIHEILHSKRTYNYLLNKFMESTDHFSTLDKKLSFPIKYCIFDSNESNINNIKEIKSSINKNTDRTNINEYYKSPKNSLEQFVIKYYYERYLKFSQLIISNETIHDLTEFNIYKTQKFKESILNNNEESHKSPKFNNQTVESIHINNNNTSQLASLEMVWESGQLLAPKQYLSPKTIIYEKKETKFESDSSNNIEVEVLGCESEKLFNKQSLLNSGNNFSESNSTKYKTNILNYRSNNSPSILVLRNSSFVYKTRQWGSNYEIDLYSLLILLSCYTAAFISVPHDEMNLEEFIDFSLNTFKDTINDNIRRSFIESFMYLLTSYNQLLFYLKSILPVIIVNSRRNIPESRILQISTLFDNIKLGFISRCINLTQEDQSYDYKKINNCYPNLLMTIIFSTCTDLMTFDLLSNVKLILGRVEMIETSKITKSQIKYQRDINEIQNDEITLDISLVAPNSSTVCLFPSWQNQVLNSGIEFNNSNSELKSENTNIDDKIGIKSSELGCIIGNLAYFTSLSKYSNKIQRDNLKKLSILILEQLCKFIINALKRILSNESSEYSLNQSISNKSSFGNKIPVSFCNMWTLKSILSNLKLKHSSLYTINKDLCNEFEIYLSCDIMTSIQLVILIIKQLPDLSDTEDQKSTLFAESTIVLLLELVSSCSQFYNKHGKTIQRIANNKENSETEKLFPPFFASSLISVVISSLNIPTYIIEAFYTENRKIILKDSSSDFTMNPSFFNIPLITKMNAIIGANPLIETFNNDITLKILPLLDSLIQIDHSELEKNKYLPIIAHQRSLKEENSINNSFELLKPPRVPFLIWDQVAHISLLNSVLNCLISLSSTMKGCISILKSDILVQIITREFISIFLNTNIELSNNDEQKNSDIETNGTYLNKESLESHNNGYMRLVTYINIGYDNSRIIRSPIHVIWCNIIFIITKIFNSIAELKSSNLGLDKNNYSASLTEMTKSEIRYTHSENEYRKSYNKNATFINSLGEKNINSLLGLSLTTTSRNFTSSLKDTEDDENIGLYETNKIENFVVPLKDNLQIKDSISKLIKLIDRRIQFVLSDSRYVSQLAMLEEFNLTVDLVRSALSLNINDFNSHLIETLRKALKTVRNISVISLGRGITESFDLFKPVSLLEKISAGQKIETINIYYLDNHLPAQVPSIFHQRCCTLILNSIRSIVSTFVLDSNPTIEFKGRELLIQLLHDIMDLGRPILQLLEDVPNHCYSVFTIINAGKGKPLIPLSLNLQGIRPCSPTGIDFLGDVKLASLNKNIFEFKGVAKISPISESCYLPEMITLKSFIQLLSSLIDIFAICGVKCLYTLESLESTDQHNDTVRRFLEFLHLAQGLNSQTLLESSRKLVEMVYQNLKSKLGDQINVEVASLVGIKKDPIHALLLDRLSNINNS